MFALADVMHLLADKLACLSGGGFALLFVPPSPFDSFFLRYNVSCGFFGFAIFGSTSAQTLARSFRPSNAVDPRAHGS